MRDGPKSSVKFRSLTDREVIMLCAISNAKRRLTRPEVNLQRRLFVVSHSSPPKLFQTIGPYVTSLITHCHEQDLTLNPGHYSVDLDDNLFNAALSLVTRSRVLFHTCLGHSKVWKYEYYCRVYGVSNFPNIAGSLLPIDDPRVDPFNPSCFSNQWYPQS